MSFLEQELLTKQDKLIKVIFETLLPYSSLNKEEFFSQINETIHSTKLFVRDSNPINLKLPKHQKYEKYIINFQKKLEELTSIKHTINLEKKPTITTKIDFEHYEVKFPSNHITHIVYNRYQKLFINLNITLPLLEEVYQTKGKYAFKNYVKELFKLDSKISSYISEKQLLRIDISLAKRQDFTIVDNTLKKYNLRNIYEARDFYNFSDLVLIDSNILSKNQAELKDKINAHLLNVLDKQTIEIIDLITLKKDLKPILKNKHLYQILYSYETSKDINEFLKTHNIAPTTNDYYRVLKVFTTLSLKGTEGVAEFIQDNNFIGVKTSISNYDNATQVGIIIHEYIHALEFLHRNDFERARSEYRQINEVLTEYLSREATKLFLPNNIFSTYDNTKQTIYAYEHYYCKIKPLMKSDIWNHLLSFKVNGDLNKLENTIGKSTLKQICNALSYPDDYMGESMMEKIVLKYNQKQISKL